MTCFHGLGSNVMDYVISEIHVLNHVTNFELLNMYELDSDHRPLSLRLNLSMRTTHMQENSESKSHIHFNKSNVDLFLRSLERNLGSLTYNNNINQIYYHFTTTLSTTITNSLIRLCIRRIIELPIPSMTNSVKLPGKQSETPLMKALSYRI